MKGPLLLLVTASAAISFAACREQAPKESVEIAVVPSAPAPAPPLPAPVAPELPPPPTEEDFEEEAAQQITSKNLEQELDKLERELNSP